VYEANKRKRLIALKIKGREIGKDKKHNIRHQSPKIIK
jgi:hypothetical protein